MKARYPMLTATLAMSACMPLEQAPLVYSSKQQFGVTVSAAVPDSPGLDVNIGYKGLDAAFVPVFVAKSCPKAPAKCDGINYNLRPITGTNVVKARSEAEREQIAKLNAAILTEKDRIESGEVAASEAKKLLDLLLQKPALDARVKVLQDKKAAAPTVAEASEGQIPAAPPALTDVEDKELEDSRKKLDALTEIESRKPEIEQQFESANTSIDASRKEKTRLEQALEAQLRLRSEFADDDKSDALSVYGSFNGSAGGGKDGASLALGKIFSTGIAAQNLSQGIGAGARAAAAADCFVEAKTIYARYVGKDDADRADYWRKLMRVCGIRE